MKRGQTDGQSNRMGGHLGKNLPYHVSNVRTYGQTDTRDGWTTEKRPSALPSCRIPSLACGFITTSCNLSLDVACQLEKHLLWLLLFE